MNKGQETSHLIPGVLVAFDASRVEMSQGRLIRAREGGG